MTRSKKKRGKLRNLLSVQNGIALGVLALCAIALGLAVTQWNIDLSSPTHLIQSVHRLGGLGVLVYIGFLIVAIVVGPIPSTPVTVAAGAVWGALPAGVYGTIGVYLGSLAAYFIGRTLGRSAVRALIGKAIYLSKHRGELYLGGLVFVIHLIPILPFDVMSYAAGISGLSLRTYASASLLGIIPCTFLLTHLGAAFTISLPIAVLIGVVFLALLFLLPWGVRRYNWLGLRNIIDLD